MADRRSWGQGLVAPYRRLPFDLVPHWRHATRVGSRSHPRLLATVAAEGNRPMDHLRRDWLRVKSRFWKIGLMAFRLAGAATTKPAICCWHLRGAVFNRH